MNPARYLDTGAGDSGNGKQGRDTRELLRCRNLAKFNLASGPFFSLFNFFLKTSFYDICFGYSFERF